MVVRSNCRRLARSMSSKSTLIKILAGVHEPDEGEYRIDGRSVHPSSRRQAMDMGIATVFQDLAPQPLSPIWRAFFLGDEITGFGGRMQISEQKQQVHAQLATLGIKVRDVDQLLGTLSGGGRQAVAIARAIQSATEPSSSRWASTRMCQRAPASWTRSAGQGRPGLISGHHAPDFRAICPCRRRSACQPRLPRRAGHLAIDRDEQAA